MSFEDLEPVIRRRRKRRRIDGRAVVAITVAVQAALDDEEKDKRILELVKSGSSYSALGRTLGISRQRATYLAERAAVRTVMLKEYRAGRTAKSMALDWHHLYPRRTGKSGKAEVEGVVPAQPQEDVEGREAAGHQEA